MSELSDTETDASLGTYPLVDSSGVKFRFRDDRAELEQVSLVQEVAWPRTGPRLERSLSDGGGAVFEAAFARPPVDRFEYRFEIVRPGGHEETILDPCNERRAAGAFGERSVVEFPEYRQPCWVLDPVTGTSIVEIDIPAPALGADQRAILWSPQGLSPREPAPLLVALDGREFGHFSGLWMMLDTLSAGDEIPVMRAVGLHPTNRDTDYTASPGFAGSLANEILPAIGKIVAVSEGRRSRLGLGASLGGLALLHTHRIRPETFGSLFIQSSSLIHHGYMPGFTHFDRIERFVNQVLVSGFWRDPIPIVMTCGGVEQNLANNRDVVAALCEQGYPAELHIVRDAHNWTAWRDAWTPHLVDLLCKMWS